jgi:hypothetical protein
MFSQRSAISGRPSRLAEAIERARAGPRPLLDLTLSNPTEAGLRYPREVLDALADPRALRYRPEPLGLPEARAAAAGEWSREGVEVDAARVVMVASTSDAYSLLFKLLCDPGDELLVPQPSYPLLEQLGAYESARLVPYRLAYDGAWHVDLASVERARSPRSRAVLLVHPNNPTGSFVSLEERARMARLGLPLISDEVFAAYAHGPDQRRARSLLGADAPLVFALDGLSKRALLPQHKLGWIGIGGREDAVAEALARLEHLCDAWLAPATPVQLALPALLEAGRAVRGELRLRIARNLAVLAQAAHDSPATLLAPSGGWYGVLRLPATHDEETWALGLLQDEGVLVQPGWLYDFADEPVVVLSLIVPEAPFAEGVGRLVARVRARA